MIDVYTYSAYGEPDNPSGNAIRYTGRRWDAETGLYYYRARYYNPSLGRFLQTDPVGYGDNTNLYAYVGNDPMNNTDPTGKIIPFIAACAANPACRGAVGGVVGATVGAIVNVVQQGFQGEGSFVENISNLDGGQVLNAAGAGFATGAVVASTGNLAAISATGAAATGASSLGSDIISGDFEENPSKSFAKAGVAALIGAVTVPAGAAAAQSTKPIIDDVIVPVVFEGLTVAGVQAGAKFLEGEQQVQEVTTPEPKKETCAIGPC